MGNLVKRIERIDRDSTSPCGVVAGYQTYIRDDEWVTGIHSHSKVAVAVLVTVLRKLWVRFGFLEGVPP